MTPYVDFDEKGLKRVGCMKCNDTIGTREVGRDGNPVLKHWSHLRRFPFTLSDGSYVDALLCLDCLYTITDDDLQHFEDTLKFGWRMEKGHMEGTLEAGLMAIKVEMTTAKGISQPDVNVVVPSDEVAAVDLGEHFENLKVVRKGKPDGSIQLS